MVFIYLLLVVAACVAIWKVSDVFEDATEYLGRNLGNGVKGASLNAIGSSMPELITSFIFLFSINGSDGYAGTIGTTAGSAVFNSLLIPAAVILTVFMVGKIRRGEGITLNPKVIKRDGFFLLLSEMALILFISSSSITLLDASILMGIYLWYSFTLIRDSKGARSSFIRGTKKQTRIAWTKLTLATIAMSLICWLLVYSVEQIGEILEVPLIFVSLILAAAASSVPDTIISIKDGLKGNYDDAVSNALGSNIFDICIAHGLPLFIYILINGNIEMDLETNAHSTEIRVGLIIITFMATLIYMFNKKLFKSNAYQLLILYVIFIIYAILRAYGVEIF